ncbi:MAG: hypothetical protein CBB65_12065 [Hyphomonadaceae bacterium TMED5]|nr:hypothetical protein [Ponticaulis sp.]OUX98488.1 MAG: hypothetical protein CBB65_12065 [Hyphomonadaceae bacterium TMED5]
MCSRAIALLVVSRPQATAQALGDEARILAGSDVSRAFAQGQGLTPVFPFRSQGSDVSLENSSDQLTRFG